MGFNSGFKVLTEYTACPLGVFVPPYRLNLSVPCMLIFVVDVALALVLAAVASRAFGGGHLASGTGPRRAPGHPVRRLETQVRGRY